MKSNEFGAWLLKSAALSALAAGLAVNGHAQDQSDQADQADEAVEELTTIEEDVAVQDKVIVTGSRLSSEYTSISPVDVISADSAVLEGITDIGTLLQTATVAAGSAQVTSATSSAFVQDGGIGTDTISLRGLGANRTLVLLNGRRAGPAGTRGAVSAFDLNAIPLAAVQSIEILKDGASSIYGSDAVAGVVNIITKKDDIRELDFYYSQPENEGGEELRISGTYGDTFDKGSFIATLDYTKDFELARGDRDYLNCGEARVFDLQGNRADQIDPRTGEFQCRDLLWGHVWLYNYLGAGLVGRPFQSRPQLLQYDYDGSLAANGLAPWGTNDFGLLVDPAFYPVGLGELLNPGATPDAEYGPTARLSEALLNFDHPFQDAETLGPEVERMTFFGAGEYEFNDNMTAYGEVLLNRRETKVNGYRQFWKYDYVYNYFGTILNPVEPSFAANGFAADPNAFSFIGLSPTPITDINDDTITVDYVNVVGGLKGNFDGALSDWSYDAFFQFSQSDGRYEGDFIYADAVDGLAYTNCDALGGTINRNGVDIPCVNVDWYSPEFLNGEISDVDRAFLFGVQKGTTNYEQNQVELYTNGPLFDLPAGTVSAGFGFNRTSRRINDVPGFATRDGNVWGASTAGITRGSDTTTAVFGEVAVPLIKDAPFAESLDLSLSARWTDVDVFGDDTTYKAGVGWQITPSIRARTSYGTSFRAPALFELFLDSQTSFLGQRFIDPCLNWEAALADGNIPQVIANNCAADGVPGDHAGAGASATISESGAIGNIEAETSTSFNIGLIWAPDWIDFRLSVDYFEFEIDDQIAQLGAENILFGCYASENFASEPLCDLFDRDFTSVGGNEPSFLITDVTNNYINVANQTNKGFDIQADYTRDFSFGTLTVTTEHTIQTEDELQLQPTSDPLDLNGLIGEPEWVGELSTTLETGPWTFFWGMEYIDGTSNVEEYQRVNGVDDIAINFLGEAVAVDLKAEEVIYHDLSVSRELPAGIDLTIGVANVFDEQPPALTTLNLGQFNTVGTSPFVSNYDFLGRRAFVSLKKTFN
ncbi:MAG: TonB-dependent receptor [Pseudomonadota bacterium]